MGPAPYYGGVPGARPIRPAGGDFLFGSAPRLFGGPAAISRGEINRH